MQCIFCKIIAGEFQTKFVYEDDLAVVFPDIHPKAPVHLLVVPKQHVESLVEASGSEALLGHLLTVANTAALKLDIASRGYKVVINVGREGGQVVPHLHVHVLGGKQMEE